MDFDLIGLLSVVAVALIVVSVAKIQPAIAPILYIALGIRILAMFLNQDILYLPDGIGDAHRFNLRAEKWSAEGFLVTLSNFPGFSSFSISWVIGILYSLFGPSELMGQSLSLLFGMGSIFMGWSITKKLWNQSAANKAGWVLALFPSLVLYSTIMLRESYVCFFLLLAINGIVDWIHNKNLKSFILVLAGFIGATFFHEPMILGLIMFILIILLIYIKIIFIDLINFKINLKILLVFTILLTSINFFKDFRVQKFDGELLDIDTAFERIVIKAREFDRGTAKYPNWAVPKDESEVFYKGPIRIIYFIYAPFPWDIKKNIHFVGMLDGFFYIFLTYLILYNRKIIWADPALRIILLMLIVYISVYGLGVGNFGTGLRHRSKFVVMFILLIAPFLPNLTFSKKKKIKNKSE
jgi:4-amino-4-deoxy-L-arabinose transferase-like glycosyltransferase